MLKQRDQWVRALKRRTAEQETPAPASTPCRAERCFQRRTKPLARLQRRTGARVSAAVGPTVFSLRFSGWSVFWCAPNSHPLGDESWGRLCWLVRFTN